MAGKFLTSTKNIHMRLQGALDVHRRWDADHKTLYPQGTGGAGHQKCVTCQRAEAIVEEGGVVRDFPLG
jgi:hypothetical protein